MKKTNVGKLFLRGVLWFAVDFVMFWFILPPLNIRSPKFWEFMLLVVLAGVVLFAFGAVAELLSGISGGVKIENNTVDFNALNAKDNALFKLKPVKFIAIVVAVFAALALLANVAGSEFFNAKRYHDLIAIEDGDFSKDVAELSMSQIPVVDRDTSVALGKRKLGEMSDLVSQFNIADNYTQINYNGTPVRVSPLVYGDAIKWLKNSENGIPGYIMVEMATQEASLVRLEDGIKYSESEYFMRNIHRYLRFQYPTKIFADVSFEIDDNGTPYWVASTVQYRIAWWSGYDVGGAVLVNAITGESAYYDLADIPTWVDQVFDSELVLQQLVYNGKYGEGFLNSMFGQSGVLQPTRGYNYLAINDDVWLYTGMTSVLADESNVGFVLANLRTKETKFYAIPGAEEYSARESAEGQVQHLGYTSTFPLLLNVANRPTYFMSLKDEAGLVKMYAFVDVAQYQIVGTGNTVNAAKSDYIAKLAGENIETPGTTSELEGVVEEIASAVVNGNTMYYLKLKNDEQIYVVSVQLSDTLPFVKKGDAVLLQLNTTDDVEVVGFTLK